jgi:ferric-dicitrate binding protein FerR (iron transport regulator)
MLWSSTTAAGVALAVALALYGTRKSPETTQTYATQAGQEAIVTLIDGTQVTLAPRTTMRIARFGASSRTVELDGQAYFEVTRSSGTPFLVRTGATTTQVLGTSFLVRHYANEDKVHVAVAAGKVSVVSTTPKRGRVVAPVTLTAGHVGDITDSTIIVRTDDDLTRETEWRRGRLVFRHAQVTEVLQTLSHWYGYQFHCGDSTLMTQNVTLSLDAHSSSAALSRLEQFLDVNLTFTGDTVTLTPRTTRPAGAARKQVYDMWIPMREVGR